MLQRSVDLQVGPDAAPVMEDVPVAPERSGAETLWFNISYERVRWLMTGIEPVLISNRAGVVVCLVQQLL